MINYFDKFLNILNLSIDFNIFFEQLLHFIANPQFFRVIKFKSYEYLIPLQLKSYRVKLFYFKFFLVSAFEDKLGLLVQERALVSLHDNKFLDRAKIAVNSAADECG